MNELDLISTDVAPDIAQLIQLFSAQADLRFPELDAAVLQDAVVRVKERSLELVRAEALLRSATAALEEEQDALLKKAQRALAYLRVFAEADEVLWAKVDAIALPRPRRTARAEVVATVGTSAGPAPLPRKRGRPRKVESGAASLFASAETSGESNAAQ